MGLVVGIPAGPVYGNLDVLRVAADIQHRTCAASSTKLPYTAFAANRTHPTDGELIVRRVRRLNPNSAAQGQCDLSATYLPISRGVH